MLSISTIGHARAHDHQHPELNSWYESLYSGKGPCCDGSDAERVDDADWETKDGHYRVALLASGLMFRTTLSWMDQPRWPHDGLALLSERRFGWRQMLPAGSMG